MLKTWPLPLDMAHGERHTLVMTCRFGRFFRCLPLLGLVLLMVGMSGGAWAGNSTPDTSLYDFPFLSTDPGQAKMLANSFEFQMSLFDGIAGNSEGGSVDTNGGIAALRYIALLAVMVGALLIAFFPKKYFRPTVFIPWLILVLVEIFVPLGSGFFFYPIKLTQQSYISRIGNSVGDSVHTGNKGCIEHPQGCGFTPQLVAVHLGSIMQMIVSDIFRSMQWTGLIDRQQADMWTKSNAQNFDMGPSWLKQDIEYYKNCARMVNWGSIVSLSGGSNDTTPNQQDTSKGVTTLGQMIDTLHDNYYGSDIDYMSVPPPMIVFPQDKAEADAIWNTGTGGDDSSANLIENRYLDGLTTLYNAFGGDGIVKWTPQNSGEVSAQTALDQLKSKGFFASDSRNTNYGWNITTNLLGGFIFARESSLGGTPLDARKCYIQTVAPTAQSGIVSRWVGKITANPVDQHPGQEGNDNQSWVCATSTGTWDQKLPDLVGSGLSGGEFSTFLYNPQNHRAMFEAFYKSINDPADMGRSVKSRTPWDTLYRVYGKVQSMPVGYGMTVRGTDGNVTIPTDADHIMSAPTCVAVGKQMVQQAVGALSNTQFGLMKQPKPYYDRLLSLLNVEGIQPPSTGSGGNGQADLQKGVLTWEDITSLSPTDANLTPQDISLVQNMVTRLNEALRQGANQSGKSLASTESNSLSDEEKRSILVNSVVNLMETVTGSSNAVNSDTRAADEDGSRIKIVGSEALSQTGGWLASWISSKIISIFATFVGPLSVAYVMFLQVLINMALMVVIVLTPFLFLFGLLIPTNAAGVLATSIIVVFVLKFVPVTLIMLNALGGMIFDLLPSSFAYNSDFIRDLMIIAMSGLYTSLIAITMFLMFKIGDTAAIMGRIAGMDDGAKEMANRGMEVVKFLATTALTAVATAGISGALGSAGAVAMTSGKGKGGSGAAGAGGGNDPNGPTTPSHNAPVTESSDTLNNIADAAAGDVLADGVEGALDFSGNAQDRLRAEFGNGAVDAFMDNPGDGMVAMKSEVTGEWHAVDARSGGNLISATGYQTQEDAQQAITAMRGMAAQQQPQTSAGEASTPLMQASEAAQQATQGRRLGAERAEGEQAQVAAQVQANAEQAQTNMDQQRGGANGAISAAGPVSQIGQKTAATNDGKMDYKEAATKIAEANDEDAQKAFSAASQEMGREFQKHEDDELNKKVENARVGADRVTQMAGKSLLSKEGKERRDFVWRAFKSGARGGGAGLLNAVSSIPIVGSAIKESVNEYYEAPARVMAEDAVGGRRRMRELQSNAKRWSYFSQQMAPATPGLHFEAAMQSGGFQSQYQLASTAAKEAVARSRSQANAQQMQAYKLEQGRETERRIIESRKEFAQSLAAERQNNVNLSDDSIKAMQAAQVKKETEIAQVVAAEFKDGVKFTGRHEFSVHDFAGAGSWGEFDRVGSVLAEAARLQGGTIKIPGKLKVDAEGNPIYKGGKPQFEEGKEVRYTLSMMNEVSNSLQAKAASGKVDEMLVRYYGILEKQNLRGGEWDQARNMATGRRAMQRYMVQDLDSDYVVGGHLRMVEGKMKFRGMQGQMDRYVQMNNLESAQRVKLKTHFDTEMAKSEEAKIRESLASLSLPEAELTREVKVKLDNARNGYIKEQIRLHGQLEPMFEAARRQGYNSIHLKTLQGDVMRAADAEKMEKDLQRANLAYAMNKNLPGGLLRKSLARNRETGVIVEVEDAFTEAGETVIQKILQDNSKLTREDALKITRNLPKTMMDSVSEGIGKMDKRTNKDNTIRVVADLSLLSGTADKLRKEGGENNEIVAKALNDIYDNLKKQGRERWVPVEKNAGTKRIILPNGKKGRMDHAGEAFENYGDGVNYDAIDPEDIE